jgi:capsular polysaccharide biosynthesis protein
MSDPRELEGEADVDLGRHVAAVAARWWLLLLGLVVGVLIALLVSVGGKDVYKASALVYPGQTLAPSGSQQVQSLATNPSTIGQIVRSEAAIRRAASASGYGSPGKLRRSTSVQAVSGNVAKTGQVQLVNIVVTGSAPRKTSAAANELAKIVLSRISHLPDTKIAALRAQIAADQQELDGIDARAAATQQALEQAGLSAVEKLVLLTNLGLTEQRRTTVQDDLGTRQQLLAQAIEVEQARVVEPAVSRKVTAQSRRNQLIVGGAVGLLLGLVAALVWEPGVRRFRR